MQQPETLGENKGGCSLFTRNHDSISTQTILQGHSSLFQHIFSLYRESAEHSPQSKPSQLPVFINKVLLKNSYTYSFLPCLWQFLSYNSKVTIETVQETSLKSLLFLIFLKKCVADSLSKSWWQFNSQMIGTECPKSFSF